MFNSGATDVYITEMLGFELADIGTIAHEHNCNIRVYPNVAQSSFPETEPEKCFFIRPEDIVYYENYVDTCEFYYNTTDNLKDAGLFIKVYKLDQEWFGPLNEIILGFNGEFDSKYISPRYGEMRTRCGKRCLKGGKCKICDVIKELSQTLEKAGLAIHLDKNDNFIYNDDNEGDEIEDGSER